MRRSHILFLERDRALREAVSDVLVEDGYVVTTVGSPEAALRALDVPPASMPDVCLIDLHDDGAVVEALRTAPERYGNVALVTLSFWPTPCAEADVELRRPYTMATLERAVEEALAKKRGGVHPDGDGPRVG